MGLLEQRRNFFVREACNAATDTGNEEGEGRVLLGKLDELVHIGFDGFYATLHRWDTVALTLQSYALSHDGPKLAVGNICRTTTMHATKIAAKHEYLVWLE